MPTHVTPWWLVMALGFALLSDLATAQPANWLQGLWNGTCTRGTRTLNAQLVLAYSVSSKATTGSLNGKPLTGLQIKQRKIDFTEGQKVFDGTFSADFNQLTAELDKGPKSARCNLTRVLKESDSLCLYNNTNSDQYVWLDSPNGRGGNATFILRAGQRFEITGDKTGTLCYSRTDFRPPPCPGSQIAQKYYSCQ